MAKFVGAIEVIVLTGKDKGKRGVVLRVLDDGHVLVEGVNRVKKASVKPNPMRKGTGRHRRKRNADPGFQCGAVQSSARRRRIAWVQGAGGRPQGACLQVQWRNG
jgi:hypothetical protein